MLIFVLKVSICWSTTKNEKNISSIDYYFHILFLLCILDQLCMDEDKCSFWTYREKKNKCFLKSSDANRKVSTGAVSGSKGCSAGNILTYFKGSSSKVFEDTKLKLSASV